MGRTREPPAARRVPPLVVRSARRKSPLETGLASGRRSRQCVGRSSWSSSPGWRGRCACSGDGRANTGCLPSKSLLRSPKRPCIWQPLGLRAGLHLSVTYRPFGWVFPVKSKRGKGFQDFIGNFTIVRVLWMPTFEARNARRFVPCNRADHIAKGTEKWENTLGIL